MEIEEAIRTALSIRPVSLIINHPFMYHYIDCDEDYEVLYLMGRQGYSFCKFYRFADDKDIIYISDLSVSKCFRKERIGTDIMNILENVGKLLGAKKCNIWAEKGYFAYEWHKRRGYRFLKEKDSKNDWLQKDLI